MRAMPCLLIAISMGVAAQGLSLNDMRARHPELAGLDDEGAARAIHAAFYSDIPIEEFAKRLGVKLWQPKPLNAFERWRYQSCREDAAGAPTVAGVRERLSLCRERFSQ